MRNAEEPIPEDVLKHEGELVKVVDAHGTIDGGQLIEFVNPLTGELHKGESAAWAAALDVASHQLLLFPETEKALAQPERWQGREPGVLLVPPFVHLDRSFKGAPGKRRFHDVVDLAPDTPPEDFRIASVEARELPRFLMRLQTEGRDRDLGLSINSTWRQGVQRKAEHLASINATWVDCDIDLLSPNLRAIVESARYPDVRLCWLIVDAIEQNDLPSPSLLWRSGRGVWCFWYVEEPGGHLQKAHPRWRNWWQRIQRRIGDALTGLEMPVDPNSRDVVRVTRVPGSVNSKSARPVQFYEAKDANGHPLYYSLPQLDEGFNPDRIGMALPPPAEERRNRGLLGWKNRHDTRRAMIEALVEMRGGIRTGTRYRTLAFANEALHLLGYPREDRALVLRELVGRFETDEDWSESDFTAAVEFGTDNRRGTPARDVGARLHVTAAEEAALRRRFPTVAVLKSRQEVKSMSGREAIEARRESLRGIVEVHPELETDELRAALISQGFEVSRSTVFRDLEALQLDRRTLRREKREEQRQENAEAAARLGRRVRPRRRRECLTGSEDKPKRKRRSDRPRISNVKPEHLADARALAALFDDAVRRELVDESKATRLAFYRAACYAVRKERQGKARSAVAVFTSIVRRERWDRGSDADERAARKLIDAAL